MKHAYFHKAVINAYERLIPEGTQPPYLLYFDVSPADIDVNIHPTKTEIKFENEQALWQILTAAVKEAIGKFCEVPTIDFDTEGRPDIPVFNPIADHPQAPLPTSNPSYNPFTSASHDASRRPKPVSQDWTALYDTALADRSQAEQPSFFDEPAANTILQEKSPAHYQYKGRYIMTAVKSGLMIIDQHRASVRIMYERYLTQKAAHSAVPQRVLFPEVLQLAPAEAAVLQHLQDDLVGMGFDVADLGGGSFVVNAVPSGVEGDPMMLVRNIVADAAEHDGTPVTTATDPLALALARNTAIPYGQVLANDEMEAIVNQLFSCSNVSYTPDGRSILSILPQHDIEHLLG